MLMQEGPTVPPTGGEDTPPTTPQSVPDSNWQFTANDQEVAGDDAQFIHPSFEPISWTASEYVDHEKNRSWFLSIVGAAVLTAAITYLLTRDLISVVVILFAGILLAVSGARKPRTLSFELNDDGLQVGQKLYPYASFKSFTIIDEGAINSIQLLPARRFMPSLNVYYPPEQEDAIITSLGSILPHEERKRDAVDSLMRRIKF